jgi:hypothetical protein
MKNSRLALCLFAMMACSRGGSGIRDAGGGATGLAGSVGSSGADSSERAADAQAGSGGGTQAAGASATIGGGGATVSSLSGGGGSSAVNVAGRTADSGGIIAGRSAVDGGTGTACWLQTLYASRNTADLLLLLDRSESMDNDIAEDCLCAGATAGSRRCTNANCKDRWSAVTSAISTVLVTTPNVHWGLKLFYSPGATGSTGDARAVSNLCRVSAEVEVPIGADSGPAILSAIRATVPAGNTPTRAAIQAASAYLNSLADQNGKYILLATDGLPNCSANSSNPSDFDETVTAIRQAGFPVYVLGIGPSLYELNTFAVVAGTAHYYPATSPDELTTALSSITESVATCTFTLSSSPPDAGTMTVMQDQTVIPKDDSNGWSYAGVTRNIVLHGDSCTKLKASPASSLKVQIVCP